MKKIYKFLFIAIVLMLCACSTNVVEEETINEEEAINENIDVNQEEILINETIENNEDGKHAIEANGTNETYTNIYVKKSGDADGDEADFYGENAAIYAYNKATLELKDIIVETDGKHANGVFSYGSGTTINISDSKIVTYNNCSGGLMTTGEGTMNASNLDIYTYGNSSAAIRSDRGGGVVNVDGGTYITEGKGSPVIYSTADITVNNAYLESKASQGVVVEGKNSVTLNNVELVASNILKNSNKSNYYQAIMIYQSMSGDALEGEASFNMTDGSLLNKNGDIFFVNNTIATITLNNVLITNEDEEGIFLRAQAASWGSSGNNGGKVNLYAINQIINGDIFVDEISALNLYLNENSVFTGSIENDGEVYVEILEGSKWVLTDDSYITSLSCLEGSIDLNGHKLYINGVEYVQGSALNGQAITFNNNSINNVADKVKKHS